MPTPPCIDCIISGVEDIGYHRPRFVRRFPWLTMRCPKENQHKPIPDEFVKRGIVRPWCKPPNIDKTKEEHE